MKSDNEITLFGALIFFFKNEEINFYEFMSEFMWHLDLNKKFMQQKLFKFLGF